MEIHCAALWLNLATAFGAPVSTTHSIVGGVTEAGIETAFSFFIKKTVLFKNDIKTSAKMIAPIMIAIMAWTFSTYILLKGFKHIIKLNFITANAIEPLAAINDAIIHSSFSAKAHIPLWVMVVGALGISLGLTPYGPKLIKKVSIKLFFCFTCYTSIIITVKPH